MDSAFGKSLFGYKKEEVERSIQKIEQENLGKIKTLEEELASANNKLLASEKARTEQQQKLDELYNKESALVDLLMAAREKADRIEIDAQNRADEIIQDAEGEYQRKQLAIERLHRRYGDFQENFRGLLAQYTGMLGQMPELVFVEENKALPSGSDSIYQERTDTAELSDGGWPPAPAGMPEAAAGKEQDETSGLAEAEEKGRIEDELKDEDKDGFKEPQGSADQLSYEPAVKEPWALSLVGKSEAAEEALSAAVVDEAEEPELPKNEAAAAPEEAVEPVAEAGAVMSAAASEWVVPVAGEATADLSLAASSAHEDEKAVKAPIIENSKYKPFTPFSKKTDEAGALAVAAEVIEAKPEEVIDTEIPGESGFKDAFSVIPKSPAESHGYDTDPATAKIVEKPDSEFEDDISGQIKGRLEKSPAVSEASEPLLYNHEFPWAERVPEEVQEPEAKDTETKDIEGGEAAEEKPASIYPKPWDNESYKNGKAGSDKGSGEPNKLKELLERHREEIERKNKKSDIPPDNTIQLDMSEEDKKFWS